MVPATLVAAILLHRRLKSPVRRNGLMTQVVRPFLFLRHSSWKDETFIAIETKRTFIKAYVKGNYGSKSREYALVREIKIWNGTCAVAYLSTDLRQRRILHNYLIFA